MVRKGLKVGEEFADLVAVQPGLLIIDYFLVIIEGFPQIVVREESFYIRPNSQIIQSYRSTMRLPVEAEDMRQLIVYQSDFFDGFELTFKKLTAYSN